MAKNFTDKLLTTSLEALPEPNETDNRVWFDALRLDFDTTIDWAHKTYSRANHLPFDGAAWLLLGIMVGIETGKATCDPSFALAVEMEKNQ